MLAALLCNLSVQQAPTPGAGRGPKRRPEFVESFETVRLRIVGRGRPVVVIGEVTVIAPARLAISAQLPKLEIGANIQVIDELALIFAATEE